MFSTSKKGKPTPAAPAPASAAKTTDGYDSKAVEALFDTLVDPEDPDLLAMDGIGKLCEQLGLDPSTDVRVLVLLWKLGAISKPGYITKQEFMQGFQNLKAGSVKKLSSLLPSFDPGFLDRAEFRGEWMWYLVEQKSCNLCCDLRNA